jgi:hypothetical protein
MPGAYVDASPDVLHLDRAAPVQMTIVRALQLQRGHDFSFFFKKINGRKHMCLYFGPSREYEPPRFEKG